MSWCGAQKIVSCRTSGGVAASSPFKAAELGQLRLVQAYARRGGLHCGPGVQVIRPETKGQPDPALAQDPDVPEKIPQVYHPRAALGLFFQVELIQGQE